MKFQKGAILAGVISIVLLATNMFDASTTARQYSKSYPPVVCPPNPVGVTTATSVASKKTPFYRVGNKSTKLVEIKTLRYSSVGMLATIQGKRISRTKVPNRPVLTLAIATGLIA